MGDFNFFIGGIYDIIELYSITIFGGYYVTQKCEGLNWFKSQGQISDSSY